MAEKKDEKKKPDSILKRIFGEKGQTLLGSGAASSAAKALSAAQKKRKALLDSL